MSGSEGGQGTQYYHPNKRKNKPQWQEKTWKFITNNANPDKWDKTSMMMMVMRKCEVIPESWHLQRQDRENQGPISSLKTT